MQLIPPLTFLRIFAFPTRYIKIGVDSIIVVDPDVAFGMDSLNHRNTRKHNYPKDVLNIKEVVYKIN